jgi:hypothetical protein
MAAARHTASGTKQARDRGRARDEAVDQAAPVLESRGQGREVAARPSGRVRIGVISDSHGYLDPEVLGVFSGVAHIVHAGDIGDRGVLAALAAIAPVTAVAHGSTAPCS